MDRPVFYLALSLTAAALNYGYQLLAAARLSSADFAGFSTWFAWLSAFLVAGTVTQYAASFNPTVSGLGRRVGVCTASAAAIAALTASMASSLSAAWLALSAISVAVLHGWVVGQAQARAMLGAMGFAAVMVAAGKVLLAIPAGSAEGALAGFQLAMTLGVLPALLVLGLQLTARVRAADSLSPPMVARGWAAPLTLAASAAALPQIDLLVLSGTLQAPLFEDFARTSLFAKAVFFLFLIAGDWALPRQLRAAGDASLLGWSPLRLFALAIGGVLLLTTAAPVLSGALGWARDPPRAMTILACANQAALGVIHLVIQWRCANGFTRTAAAALATTCVVALAQRIMAPGWLTYFGLALLGNALLLAVLSRREFRGRERDHAR